MSSDRSAAWLERIGRLLREPSFVVFQQQLPRPRVLLDNFEHRPPFVGNERVLSQCSSKQTHCLFDLAQPSFPKTFFIERVAAQ